MKKCPDCHGYGYTECVAYYYGRSECPSCGGCGVVKENGEPFEDEHELEEAVAERDALLELPQGVLP